MSFRGHNVHHINLHYSCTRELQRLAEMLCVRDEEKNVLHLQLDAGRGKIIVKAY
jgi:hypothetical protein